MAKYILAIDDEELGICYTVQDTEEWGDATKEDMERELSNNNEGFMALMTPSESLSRAAELQAEASLLVKLSNQIINNP